MALRPLGPRVVCKGEKRENSCRLARSRADTLLSANSKLEAFLSIQQHVTHLNGISKLVNASQHEGTRLGTELDVLARSHGTCLGLGGQRSCTLGKHSVRIE